MYFKVLLNYILGYVTIEIEGYFTERFINICNNQKIFLWNMKRKGKKTFDRLNHLLEIPKEISTDLPKITILGFKQMLIENYKGVLEYQDFYIRISTYIGILNINGYELYLEEMTSDDLMVTGKIESFDFEPTIDE